MQYLIRLMDASNKNMAVLSCEESEVQKPAIDVVFELIGVDDPEQLVSGKRLPESQVQDLKNLQSIIFESDAQGMFIRDGISFRANGSDLDPDAPIINAFLPAEKDGNRYFRCELIVSHPQLTAPGGNRQLNPQTAQAPAGPTPEQLKLIKQAVQSAEDSIKEFARVMFIHQIAVGYQIDVTKEIPELIDIIAAAEKDQLIEIDVQKAAYKLTAEGRRLHDSFIAEAQDLIRRFDIYGDVDIDSNGNARFDTGLGKDLRVPVFEVEGVNPFRARFLVGLSDGEWDKLSDWPQRVLNTDWYQEIFNSVEVAPSVEDIGQLRLKQVIDQGKAAMRAQR